MNAASDASGNVQSAKGQPRANQFIQPFHAENLILNKIPNYFHPHSPFLQQSKDEINILNADSVSQSRE